MDEGRRKVSQAMSRDDLRFKLFCYVREKLPRVPKLEHAVKKFLGPLLDGLTILSLFSLVFWGWHVLCLQEASPSVTKSLLESPT